jgi:geranylgeranyl reductase family protein
MTSQRYNSYDLTIIGAGPAGSILAYELAKKGVKVLILEKYKLPRQKVCAGGITVRAHTLLPFDISQVVEEVAYGVSLSYNLAPKRVRTCDKPLAYMVNREQFDYFLVLQACQAGATLVDGIEVRHIESGKEKILVQTSQGTFSTPFLVGADGANSVVVQSCGQRKGFEFGLGLNANITIDQKTRAKWQGLIGLDMGIPGGYAWVFPKADCLSVGVGGPFNQAKKLRSYTQSLTRAFDLGEVDERSIKGHLMPFRKSGTPLSYPRMLLVGDAAGLVDPLTGEGIYYALKSSFLAASTIMKFFEGKTSDLKEYDHAIDKELMPEYQVARKVQKLNIVTPRIFFHYLKDNDRCWRAFCGVLRGERTMVGLKGRLSPPLRLLFRFF